MTIHNQRGQSLIEYVILVALVAVATMGLVRTLQKTVNVNLAKVVFALQGRHGRQPAQHDSVSASDVAKKDFSNFISGSHGRKSGGDGAGEHADQ